MLVSLKFSQSPDLESFLVTAHGVLYKFDAIMQTDAVIIPKSTGSFYRNFHTIIAVALLSFTVKTSSKLLIRTFVGKACRFRSIPRDSEFLSAFRARNHIWVRTRSLNPVQAVKAKAVQARQ